MTINRTRIPMITDGLSAEILQKFNIGPNFLSVYYEGVDLSEITCIDDLYKDTISKEIFNFAFSTNLRGRGVRDLIMKEAPIRSPVGLRYLDIGTAYAGFMVAFAEAGCCPLGIEINPKLIRLGHANLLDHDAHAEIIEGDFTKIDLKDLGRFEIITCNDVIEHVSDPIETIQRIADLLVSNGVAFFEIPNSRCFLHVMRDGHFRRFGVNLLPHFEAKAYLEQEGIKDYSVGEFYALDWYQSVFSRFHLNHKLLEDRHRIASFEDVPKILHQVSNSFHYWSEHAAHQHSSLMVERIKYEVSEYLSSMAGDYATAIKSQKMDSFIRKYLHSFWSVLVTKP